MLYDPEFVASVHADAPTALAGLELNADEIADLVATDRRAWGHDPLRRLRTLRTLVDEFKSSSTMLMAATRSLRSLDAFFSSAEFHASIQHRGSLAVSFAEFLERIRRERAADDALLADVLRLETMMVRCRRALGVGPDVGAGGAVVAGEALDMNATAVLAPGHAVGRFDANVVEAMNAVERYLFEVGLMPAVALCDDGPRLDGMPREAGAPVYLLALPAGTTVSLMPVDADYFALLDAFSGVPRQIDEAFREIEGVAREDLVTMMESLVEEGVLRLHGPS